MKMNCLLPVFFAFLALSCGKDNPEGTSGNDGFPKLETVIPEEDQPMSKKSEKRGICTLLQIGKMPEFLGEGVSWCYNWGHNPLPEAKEAALDAAGITFLPMVWSISFNSEHLAIHQHNGCGYVLGYNEPNLMDQARLTPEQAAKEWVKLIAEAKRLGLKVVGPAVNYGTMPGYGDPTVWYDDFLAQPGISLDDIDAIALHAYMSGGNAVKQVMIRKFAKYGKPLWLTEFADGEAKTAEQQARFMQEAVTYLEADPAVERYAWFMDTITHPAAPHFPLVTGPELATSSVPARTDLGLLYTYMSSYDKETYYPVDVNIPAESYSGQIEEESAPTNSWGPMVSTRLTTDMYGNLEIYGLTPKNWVEYNVDIPKAGKYRLDLRYKATGDSVLLGYFEGENDGIFSLPDTGVDEWFTKGFVVSLKAGKQTIRLTGFEGDVCLNWLRITSPLK